MRQRKRKQEPTTGIKDKAGKAEGRKHPEPVHEKQKVRVKEFRVKVLSMID
jgi:hypothetical protein